ncbi:MAG: D-alanyl-D-alanine carboxypeptidase [Clostridia bacterium]|nr:D-alanyl-D-alanine carboxypeptidase [Clostridia bacterium]
MLLVICLILPGRLPVAAETVRADGAPTPDCKSAILMEASTGMILMEQNADEPLPPASVTKVMTLLLVMEAIEGGRLRYEDMVTASAHACSMGGSQIYLKEGEQMTAEDMIKSVVIASANDAAVALAEHLAGSEEAFVEQMNRRARELGMVNTNFENTNGLDDTATNHVTSARDIALMSRELIRHKKITEYSSIWMDTVRNGSFGLTNTNRLVRFYRGATGLKTGSTSKAGFCVSATAERDGMTLICVIMGAPSRDIRNGAATALLDYGFANYTVYAQEGKELEPLSVLGGLREVCGASFPHFETVIKKGDGKRVEYVVDLPETLTAPIAKGEKIGSVEYRLDGKVIGSVEITATESVPKIRFVDVLLQLLKNLVGFS